MWKSTVPIGSPSCLTWSTDLTGVRAEACDVKAGRARVVRDKAETINPL